MKFSAKTRYGTRALLDLAMHQESNSPVPLKEIAGRQDISLTYLEHIIAPLIAAGLINSVRGTRGGISLAKIARDITLKEVVRGFRRVFLAGGMCDYSAVLFPFQHLCCPRYLG